jgi:hypothetical protein
VAGPPVEVLRKRFDRCGRPESKVPITPSERGQLGRWMGNEGADSSDGMRSWNDAGVLLGSRARGILRNDDSDPPYGWNQAGTNSEVVRDRRLARSQAILTSCIHRPQEGEIAGCWPSPEAAPGCYFGERSGIRHCSAPAAECELFGARAATAVPSSRPPGGGGSP